MEIVLYKTSKIPKVIFHSYIEAYNKTFHKSFNADYFIRKYSLTVLNDSFHVFLVKDNRVLGAQTAIPYSYSIESKTKIVCLSVDIFILPECRNPALLYRMYLKLRERLLKEGVSLVIGVPNDNVYLYQKKVMKFKDIGRLPYYALPCRLGRVIEKFKFISPFSLLTSALIVLLNSALGKMLNAEEEEKKFEVDRREELIEKQRYSRQHRAVRGKTNFVHSIVNEDGVKAAYLIDFYNSIQKKDSSSLIEAVKFIFFSEKIDIILFVGTLNFRQFILFKVPERLEPKRLRLVGDILDEKLESSANRLFDLNNWAFGLFNFDVR